MRTATNGAVALLLALTLLLLYGREAHAARISLYRGAYEFVEWEVYFDTDGNRLCGEARLVGAEEIRTIFGSSMPGTSQACATYHPANNTWEVIHQWDGIAGERAKLVSYFKFHSATRVEYWIRFEARGHGLRFLRPGPHHNDTYHGTVNVLHPFSAWNRPDEIEIVVEASARVVLWNRISEGEKWHIEHLDDNGKVLIRNAHDDLYLGTPIREAANGTPVMLYGRASGGEVWIVEEHGDHVALRNQLTGFYLGTADDAPARGDGAILYERASRGEMWKLVPLDGDLVGLENVDSDLYLGGAAL